MKRLWIALHIALRIVVLLAAGLVSPGGVGAEPIEVSSPASRVGFDQKLGASAPLDLVFRDEEGREIRLRDAIGGRPAILQLAYYECPMLCTMAIEGLATTLKAVSKEPGREFVIVTVSFKPDETPEQARARKREALAVLGRPEAGPSWRFLTGSEASIAALTSAVGFRYAWDEEQKQYAHATGIVLITPEGVISRYFFGVEYKPRDIELGLVESSSGRIGTLADKLLLLCYHYDPSTGRYGAIVMNGVRAAGALTVLVMVGCLVWALRRERRTAREADLPAGAAGTSGPAGPAGVAR